MFALLGLVLIVLDVIFFVSKPNLMYFLLVIIVLLIVLPFVVVVSIESQKQKDKETKFLEFARDLVESVKSGTPISKAIFNLRNRDYGKLSPHVQKLANQLALGIPLTTGLSNFALDTKSKVISRAVDLISEAEKSGGEIEMILNTVANSVNQIEELKKEQRSAVYNLVVQGYIIFFVFIIIVLVLQYYILPMTQGLGGTGGGGLPTDLNSQLKFNSSADLGTPLLWLLLVQSLFAGIVIGKISEGTVKDGLKHTFILLSITLVISFGAKLFLGSPA